MWTNHSVWVEEQMEGKRVRQVKGDEVDVGRERGCSFGLKARRSKSKLFFMNKRRAHRKRMKRKKTESERCTAWKELTKGGQTISGTPNKQGKTQYVCVRVSQLQISAGVGGGGVPRWDPSARAISLIIQALCTGHSNALTVFFSCCLTQTLHQGRTRSSPHSQ